MLRPAVSAQRSRFLPLLNFEWGAPGERHDNNHLLRCVSAFDSQKMKGNWLKLTLDWTPMPLVGVSLEGIWRDNDYKSVTLGRADDRRREYYLTTSYGNSNGVRVAGFAHWEQVKIASNHRYIASNVCNAATGPNRFGPSTVPRSAGAYNCQPGLRLPEMGAERRRIQWVPRPAAPRKAASSARPCGHARCIHQ